MSCKMAMSSYLDLMYNTKREFPPITGNSLFLSFLLTLKLLICLFHFQIYKYKSYQHIKDHRKP